MKKIIQISLILFSIQLNGQDPSFSQFDLSMNHSNPAYTSYEGGTRILSHSRNQWNRINENFNNSLFEISSRIKLNKNSRKLKSSWCFGASVISEDLEFLPAIGNSVFIKKKEVSLYPFTIEMKITRNSYISFAPLNISFRKYDLDATNLIFTDMINDYNNIISTTNFNPNVYLNNEWVSDWSYGFIYTRHGKFSNNKTNRFNIGFASHHITKPVESFSGTNNSESEIPTKYTIHSEWYSAIPSWRKPFIPYYRTMIKHETYRKKGNNIFTKTEFGGTAFINNTPIEFGLLWRINNNPNQNLYLQTWVPILRYRMNNGQHLYILSYSYDGNIAPSNQHLQFLNTSTTHEVGLAIYLYSGRNRNRNCAAFDLMDNNPLFQDLMNKDNNGLLNKRSIKGNFKWF